MIKQAVFNTGSEVGEELQYSAVHDGDLRKSHPEVEGTVMRPLCPRYGSGLSLIRKPWIDRLTSQLAFLFISLTCHVRVT